MIRPLLILLACIGQAHADDLSNRQDYIVALVHQMIESRVNGASWQGTYVFDNLDVCVDFKAKNAYGQPVKAFATFIDGKFKMNSLKAWNARCGDRGAVRYY
jgi:hypothetical protein